MALILFGKKVKSFDVASAWSGVGLPVERGGAVSPMKHTVASRGPKDDATTRSSHVRISQAGGRTSGLGSVTSRYLRPLFAPAMRLETAAAIVKPR